MADTIDIIYKFIADTKQFDKEVQSLRTTDLSKVKLPDVKAFETYMQGVNKEINRLVKTERLSAEQGEKLKKEYAGAKNEIKEIAKYIDKMKNAGGLGGFTTREGKPLQQPSASVLQETAFKTKDSTLFQQAYEKTFISTKKGLIDVRTGVRASLEAIKDFNKMSRDELQAIADNVKNKPVRSFRELGKEISMLVRDFRGFARIGSSLTQIGQTFAIAGAAITAGIGKSAADYIKAQEALGVSNQVTRDWAKSMERVQANSSRVGKVFASELIPFLGKGADMIGKIADFLEKNPGAAANAFKLGLGLTVVGGAISILGKGITLAADTAFLAASLGIIRGGETMDGAAIGMNVAADKMALAAGKSAAASIFSGGTATGGIAKALGASLFVEAAAALAVFIGTVYAGNKVLDKYFGDTKKFSDYVTTFKQALTLDAKGLGDFFGKSTDPLFQKIFKPQKDLGDDWFKKVREALFKVKKASDDAGDSLSGISDLLANSAKREEVLAAYEQYKADDLELVRKHYEDRRKVIEDALADEIKANERFAADVRAVYAREAKALTSAANEFNKQNDKDEAKYNEDRKKIIQGSKDEILKIEQDLQEKLRKLKMEYQEREVDLLAARDAVGLIKNRQKYLNDQTEAQREANKEIAQRRQDIRQKLEDLQVSYEQERAQRQADYIEKINEIKANAKEELEQLQAKHAAELREIQLNRNARLKELDTQLAAERKRRQDAFLAQVRDLDAALLGEDKLYKMHHDAMLKELDTFLARYRTGFSTLVGQVAKAAGDRQVGGYVNAGLYRLHQGEYVLNPSTTRMLENVIGGQLTQSNVLQAAGQSVRKSQVIWNDTRRFDSRLNAEDRRMLNNDNIRLLSSALGGA